MDNNRQFSATDRYLYNLPETGGIFMAGFEVLLLILLFIGNTPPHKGNRWRFPAFARRRLQSDTKICEAMTTDTWRNRCRGLWDSQPATEGLSITA